MLSIFKYSTLKKTLVRCMFVSMAQVLRQNEPLLHGKTGELQLVVCIRSLMKIFKNVVADQDRNQGELRPTAEFFTLSLEKCVGCSLQNLAPQEIHRPTWCSKQVTGLSLSKVCICVK